MATTTVIRDTFALLAVGDGHNHVVLARLDLGSPPGSEYNRFSSWLSPREYRTPRAVSTSIVERLWNRFDDLPGLQGLA